MQPFVNKIAKKILGNKYSVSFAFITDTEMKKLNKKYRGKNKTTDILSFNLDKDAGEILISKKEAAKKAYDFGLKASEYLHFILIHGILHLKGFDHGGIMEEQEKRFCKMFDIKSPYTKSKIPSSETTNATKNNSRNRYRNLPSKSGSLWRSRRK